MKAKLLVLALLLTAFALATEPPAWAYTYTCPPSNCFDVTQDCVDSGGGPVPYAPGQTCIGPPHGDQYTVNFISCRHNGSTSWTLVCYY